MFVKKDLRKVPEILKDHSTKVNEERRHIVNYDESTAATDLNLHLSKRKAEFRGSTEILRQQPSESLQMVTSMSL